MDNSKIEFPEFYLLLAICVFFIPAGMSYKELDERLENDPNIIVCWK